MNKIKFAFLLNLCFLFSFFYSCKKEEQKSTISVGSASFDCLPDNIIYDNNSNYAKYFFDNQKRISRIQNYSNEICYEAAYYTYNFSEAIVTDSSVNGINISKYGLNAQGYPTYYVTPPSNPNFIDTIFYFYDTENHIVQENDTSWHFGLVDSYNITTHQIINGNRVYSLTSFFDAGGNFQFADTSYYEYYPDKQNIFDFDFGLKGKKNTNLLKHKYQIYHVAQISLIADFNYDLDNSSYIKREGQRLKRYQSVVLLYNDTSNVRIKYRCN